jgi:hypothetical protein
VNDRRVISGTVQRAALGLRLVRRAARLRPRKSSAIPADPEHLMLTAEAKSGSRVSLGEAFGG